MHQIVSLSHIVSIKCTDDNTCTLSYTSFYTHTHTHTHVYVHPYIQILGVELSIHNAVHRMYTDSYGNIRPESELPSPWQYLYRVQESGSQVDKKNAAKRG